jgi:PAS domain S-box-containing protein
MQVVTNRLPRYGIAVVSTAGASLLALLLSPLSLRVPFVLFAAAVIITSLEGGLKPGLLATILSASVLGALYWLLPLSQLPENKAEGVLLLVLFVIVGLTSNYLGRQCWRAIHAVEWVQATLASFGDGLIFTDADGHVTFINSTAHRLTGWNEGKTVQRSSQPVCHNPGEDECHSLERAIVRVLRSKPTAGEPEEKGTIRFSMNGAAEATDAQAAPLCNRDGSLLGAMVVLRNATAAQQKARDLRQREEQFRALASCAPVGLLQMDPECRSVYTNCSCQLIGGFSAEEGLGEGWTRFLHPDDQARVVPAWTAAMQAGTEFACEFRFQGPDPTARWVRLRSSPMFSDVGKVIGHVGVLDDILDHKTAEETLRETRTLLSAVAESCPDALFVRDTQGRCLLTNAAGARMVGKAVKEVVGKDEGELFAGEAVRHLREHNCQSLNSSLTPAGAKLESGDKKSDRAQLGEPDGLAPDSERAYVTRKLPFRDDQGNLAGLVTVCREVTQEKRLKTELVKVNAALELEVHARQRAEEEVRQGQAQRQSCEKQATELTRVTAQLQDEMTARQQTEERFREVEAQLHAGEVQLADLAKAKAMLQEAVQAAERSSEERSTEVANLKASLQEETAARQRAEEAGEEYRVRFQELSEGVTNLENAKTVLDKRPLSPEQATERLGQENEPVTEGSADAILRNGSQ